MQYVRNTFGSVSTAWNSINPATLSGAIDVIVVEQEDGTLASSPFHVRFGKFSLLRPSDKKVEFKVNGEKKDLSMKLGEGGEAFFVFETQESIPEALQTSPLISPTTSPDLAPDGTQASPLQEPDSFDLEENFRLGRSGTDLTKHRRSTTAGMDILSGVKAKSENGTLAMLSEEAAAQVARRRGSTSMLGPAAEIHGLPKLERTATDSDIPVAKAAINNSHDNATRLLPPASIESSPTSSRDRASSPSPSSKEEAVTRAINLSKKLWTSNIPTQVTESGDLMLDMTGYKADASEALQAEGIARKLLSEELEGPYDIGGLIGADENGNLWIYSSEEAKAAASRRATSHGLGSLEAGFQSADAISDPGYHSDDNRSESVDMNLLTKHIRHDSDSALGISSTPSSPAAPATAGDPNRNYAKTLRLTSDQLKSMDLKLGDNSMTFTVNRATCAANLWYWKHDVPIVISDIDGTITKSDVLGHVLNTIGRDWTHLGVAKLYTEIAANGYNFLYLTSRSVGQADTTRAYLDGVAQDGYKLPKGPVILSPDRTIAALRREIYLRKPEIFKMACLRDIMALFVGQTSIDPQASVEVGLHSDKELYGENAPAQIRAKTPFYAGFGNRLTDAMSYRSVNIPSTRIFTINSNSEVSLDLLSLNKYKTGYSSMREIVDHYFPPTSLRLQQSGGEDFTDFNYWRDKPLDLVDFTDSEDEEDELSLARTRSGARGASRGDLFSEDEGGEEDLMDSYLSEDRLSLTDMTPATLIRTTSRGVRQQVRVDEDETLSEPEDDAEPDGEDDDVDTDEELPRTPDSGIQRRLDQLLGTTPRQYGDRNWDSGLTRSWDSD